MAAYGADSTLSELDELIHAAHHARRPFEPQWVINIAYYLGQQWIKVDGAGMLFNVELGDERVTLTDNRIKPTVRAAIAKQTKQQPSWVGVPKDPSDEEIQRARLRSIVFEHYWRGLQARRKLNSALWYRELTGAGFWKVTWDETLGEKVTVLARPDGGPVLLDQFGRPMKPEMLQGAPAEVLEGLGQVQERQIATGDVALDLRSPFEMFLDPLGTEEGLDTCEYIGEEAIYSLEYLQRRYPNAPGLGDIVEDTAPQAGIMEARFPGLASQLKQGRGGRGAPKRRGVRVREIWTGDKHCVWIPNQDIELVAEEAPYPFKPYVMFAGLPAGRLWPQAPVDDYISPQTELNKTESQIAENAERFGNPARLRSSESLANDADWQGLPGEEIIYNVVTGGVADVPQFLQPPEMPGYVQNRVPQIIESLNAISGNQEVAQGTVPEGVTAASAISMLLEANDTMLGPQIEEMKDALVDAGKRILWYLRAFAKTERMARIAGEESTWDIYAFTGEKLGDASADEVEIGSALSQSQAAQQSGIQFMLNLLIQNGQVPPPRELRKLMRAYGVGGMENFFATLGRTQRFVIEEHRRMMAGEILGDGQVDPQTSQPITTNTFDDDQIHVEEHTDFQMSATYQEAIRKPGGQRIRQIVEMHVAEHRAKLQAAADQQALAQMAMMAAEKGQAGPGEVAASANGAVPPNGAVSSAT